jgi:transcriptional regulator with XRE-family HTH domain
LKEAKGYTQQQIADESGVPIGTIGKYFSALDDESASYEILRRLVVCLGGSLDEMAGIRADEHKADGDADQAYKAVIAGLEARLDEKNERIEQRGRIATEDHQRAEEAIAYERRRARIAMAISYIVMGLIVLMFVVDWMVPTVGWIR